MDVAIVSDSHIPTRAAMIPPPFRETIRAADHVVHAGDFDTREAFQTIRDLATDAGAAFTAVRGNTDPYVLDLPEVTTVELGDRTAVVTHGAGSRHDHAERVAAAVRETSGPEAVGITGHTHELADREVGGVRVLNPGSVTGARPASRATMLVADPVGEFTVEVHEA
ncbi:MAG: metallophosphoesterase family protein [Halobacteriaceae archaeon]